LNTNDFLDVVSGRRRGVVAIASRGLLRVAETPYALATRLRNVAFDRGWKSVERVPAPVVSVGNITTGGTGKTPMVAWLARWLRERDARVAIVSRGYGAERGHLNDEAIELEQTLPDVPHVQQPDRVAGARMAIEEFESQLILLDDGFQHRRLARDLDLVLIDALAPFGYGHVLPRGLLREPLAGLKRAQAIILSRADMVDAETRGNLRATIRRYAPAAGWIEAAHRPAELLSSTGATTPLSGLAAGRWGAFCGIGNPAAFRQTLARLGCEPVAWREFPDHHRYAREDVEQLANLVQREKLTGLVCTHKDLVKLSTDSIAAAPLWALRIGIELLAGEDHLNALLTPLAERATQAE
jgi:tetraacyldisaccharide 4'-kinase